MAADEMTLNPPVGYGWGWWLAAVLCVVGLVALTWAARRALRATAPESPEDVLTRLRRETLTALDAALVVAERGEVDGRTAAGRMGASTRRFIGIVSAGDADFTTLPRLRRAALRDARLGPVVAFTAWLEPQLFSPDATVEPSHVHARAVEVVQQWR